MNKIAHYRRALWLAAGGPTLEALLRLALGNCPTVEATKFEYRAGSDVQISERSDTDQGIGIYFTLYSEGRQAATVQNGGPRINRRRAPTGEEFLRTGVHLVVQGNHAAYLADGHTNDGQISGLFHRFFEHAGRPMEDTQFALRPRADRHQIARLLRAGVKSIDLGVSAFATAIDDLNDEAPVSPLAHALTALVQSIRNFGDDERTAQETAAASEIQANVHLGYDGRNANHLLPMLLSRIAGDVTENAGEFRILTTDDVLITHDKLVIRREVDVDGDEVAIDPTSAFAVLRTTLREWRNAGIFEQ